MRGLHTLPSHLYCLNNAEVRVNTDPQWEGSNVNVVMSVSMVLCAAIGVWGVADPAGMTGAAQALVSYSLTALDWFFLLL